MARDASDHPRADRSSLDTPTHRLCVLPRTWRSIVIRVLHPLHVIAFREVREFFVIRGQLYQSRSRIQSSRRDRSSTPFFPDHAIHFIALPHDPATQSFLSGCCSPTVSSRHRAAFLEDQSLLVGINAFLVFTSSMVSLAFDQSTSVTTQSDLFVA